MKHFSLRSLGAAVAVALLAISCTKDTSYRSVAEKFANAIFNGNYEEAKQYATVNSFKVIDFVALINSSADSLRNVLDSVGSERVNLTDSLSALSRDTLTKDTVAALPQPKGQGSEADTLTVTSTTEQKPAGEKPAPYTFTLLRDSLAPDGKTAYVWCLDRDSVEVELLLEKDENKEWKVNYSEK